MAQLLRSMRQSGIFTSMLTYSVLYPGANAVQQAYFREGQDNKPKGWNNVDWHEVARFGIYGGLFHAPIVHNWLRIANKLFPGQNIKQVLAKVAMDQTCFAPVALTSFYVGLSLLEGKDKEGVYQEWNNKFWKTWFTSVFIWPILQTINFSFVPANRRVIYVGCCSFFWTTMLAAWKHESKLELRQSDADSMEKSKQT